MCIRDQGLLCALAFCSVGLLHLSEAAADKTTISGPVGLYFSVDEATGQPLDGTGLCMTSAIANFPSDLLFYDNGSFVAGVNLFIDNHRTVDMDADERVVQSLFDLSNNEPSADLESYGDFVGTPGCFDGGCGFFLNDNTTRFGSRLRGYLNVPPQWVGEDVHFGFYVDDAASLTLFDRTGAAYLIETRPIVPGEATGRFTDTVVFEEPGIYPIEILYVQLSVLAALEMSYYVGLGLDVYGHVNQTPNLSNAFELFPESMFFQTLSGGPSFDNLDECQQCSRQFVNVPGNNECNSGYYCNEAALCAPCDNGYFCGLSCVPCGGNTPFCGDPGGDDPDAGLECVECLLDEDCQNGFSCDPDTYTCNECNIDSDCVRGEYCDNHQCVTCDTSDSCAGNSCSCCPNGADGTPLECAPIDQGGPPVCMECAQDADCATGVCDVQIGRCVDQLFENERSDCCGPNCAVCPADHPYCLPGPLGTSCAVCRWDTDCSDGAYCQSGECLPCDQNRHCGGRCESCGDDTPFCKAGQTAEFSLCVACEDDSQCLGGSCDLAANTCNPEPSCGGGAGCGGDTPNCYGDTCVECFADTHCPCNGTCDLSTNTCLSSCKTNRDCLGYEHCGQNDNFDSVEKVCKVGPNVGQSPCGALATSCVAFACTISSDHAPGRIPLGTLALMFMALLMLTRIRRRGGVA